ncbi:hypothetical protein Tco_0923406 [Tanacetum coccineum]|uniref:Uncharacterized protein n=1 Tax=Tanacetum coccineum TaxID=301880 RepID=A0ABQ5D3R6_9ASTR
MSLSLAKNVIIAGADNRPPMLDKTQYSSWASLTEPGTLTTPAIVRTRRYDELILKSFEKLVTLKQQTLFYKTYHKIFIIWRESQSLNTKFINHLEYEWSKLFMDVKLAKDLHNTNFDHLYAHLRQHEAHANEVRIMKERFPNPLALVANTYNSSPSYTNQTLYHQQLSPFAPQQFSPLALHQLNDGPMVTIQDGRVTVQTVQGRQNQGYRGSEEGHMERKCTKPKRPRNSTWFKEKALLVEALELGMVLDEEQMAFLADNGDTVTTSQQS